MQKIRWGVLSTAKIGVNKVVPAMQQGKYSEIVAISSRDRQKAGVIAKKLNIPKAYGSYDALLADPDIDAIYNPLPNHLHVPWSIKALEAGKHVLCEKPIGLSAAEGQSLLDAAAACPQLKVMEAFMYRFHPQWQWAKKTVDSGKIGRLQTISSFFSYHNIDPENIRNRYDIGGGGLMDIGCYCISLARFIFNAEPARVSGTVEYDPEFKTDRLASGMLDFGPGSAVFTCSTRLSPFQRVFIFGTAGHIEIMIPFNAPNDVVTEARLYTAAGMQKMIFDICDQYTIQGDLMSRAILDHSTVPTPLEDAVANMRIIESVIASSSSGQWVKPFSV